MQVFYQRPLGVEQRCTAGNVEPKPVRRIGCDDRRVTAETGRTMLAIVRPISPRQHIFELFERMRNVQRLGSQIQAAPAFLRYGMGKLVEVDERHSRRQDVDLYKAHGDLR